MLGECINHILRFHCDGALPDRRGSAHRVLSQVLSPGGRLEASAAGSAEDRPVTGVEASPVRARRLPAS